MGGCDSKSSVATTPSAPSGGAASGNASANAPNESVVKLYIDYRSQPSRSLSTFLKSTSINHEIVTVDLFKGEHKSPKWAPFMPFGTVPAISQDDFRLSECVAIFRYLVTTYASKVPAHWYPADPKVRAKINEYMSYHHTGVRTKCMALLTNEVLMVMGGAPKPTDEKMEELNKGLEDALDKFEQLFLCEGDFIAGGCSFADLLFVNELANMELCSKDFLTPRPKVKAYVDRVKTTLNPTYDDDCHHLKKWVSEFKGM